MIEGTVEGSSPACSKSSHSTLVWYDNACVSVSGVLPKWYVALARRIALGPKPERFAILISITVSDQALTREPINVGAL